MKNAETWADENSDICENYIAVGELVDLIRAVQADALRAAAEVAEARSKDAYLHGFMDPEIVYSIVCREISDDILALINKEPKP